MVSDLPPKSLDQSTQQYMRLIDDCLPGNVCQHRIVNSIFLESLPTIEVATEYCYLQKTWTNQHSNKCDRYIFVLLIVCMKLRSIWCRQKNCTYITPGRQSVRYAAQKMSCTVAHTALNFTLIAWVTGFIRLNPIYFQLRLKCWRTFHTDSTVNIQKVSNILSRVESPYSIRY